MSKRLFPVTSDAAVTLATAAATLPFPPVAGQIAVVPSGWTGSEAGTVPEFEVDLWGTGALTLTAGELFAAKQRALALAGVTVTAANVDATANTFTHNAHGLKTGDGPAQWTSTATLPAGLALLTDYWVIIVDANTFKVATSLANALAGTAVDITDQGTALSTHTLTVTASGKRLRWCSRGLLNASISLDVDRAYSVRCEHNPDVVAYAVVGTLSANAVTGTILPVQER